jgi:glutathione peroxidase-family protein
MRLHAAIRRAGETLQGPSTIFTHSHPSPSSPNSYTACPRRPRIPPNRTPTNTFPPPQDLKKSYPNDVEFLGFPCNQFGNQDPGSNDEIQEFCQLNYGVSFPVLGKIDVNGSNAAPVFEWLKNEKPGLLGLKRVKWNFEKFLVGRDGKVKGRWASTTKPESLRGEIEKVIKEGK